MIKFVLVFALFCCVNGLPNWYANTQSDRIVGGEPAARNEIPYQILLLSFGQQHCGGSILNENHIVTAAHCVGNNPSPYSIVAGEHELRREEGTEQTVAVSQVFIHEGYGTGYGTNANDIAILRLATPLTFNHAVQSIALPKSGHISTGIVQTSGWGALRQYGSGSNILYKVRVPIIDDDLCADSYAQGSPFTVNGELMICAGHLATGGQDSCQGDSGGPLVAYDNGEYLAGVVSWGKGCALPKFPGVYTETVQYLPWIYSIINESG